MKIKKISLINGAYAFMRISGLTANPTPEDVSVALVVGDDLAAQLLGRGIDLGWNQPEEYGESDPDDTSGLTNQMAGPFKKLLAIELLDYFGKTATPTMAGIASEAMRTLEEITVSIPTAQLPGTLPYGSGNEDNYRSRRFYPDPARNNDAIYVFKNDILNYKYDFSQWVGDELLSTVTWEAKGGGITISNEIFDESTATADLLFNKIGGYTICITATKTNSSERFTVDQNFIVRDCNNAGLNYGISNA